MNIVAALGAIPIPFVAMLIASNVVPYLSQLATKAPTWATGAITFLLSLLGAVLAAVAHAGSDNWRTVAAVTGLSWVVARLHLNTLIKGTAVEAWLISHGVTAPSAPAEPAKAA